MPLEVGRNKVVQRPFPANRHRPHAKPLPTTSRPNAGNAAGAAYSGLLRCVPVGRNKVVQRPFPAKRLMVGEVSPTPPLREEPSETQSAEPQRAELNNRGRAQHHHTEAAAEAVAVVRSTPVADGTARVVLIAVPRTAPHDPVNIVPHL